MRVSQSSFLVLKPQVLGAFHICEARFYWQVTTAQIASLLINIKPVTLLANFHALIMYRARSDARVGKQPRRSVLERSSERPSTTLWIVCIDFFHV